MKWGPVLPPGRVPSLVDADGDLLATPALTHERPADPDEVLAELEAQLRRLRDLGLRVQYVDTHMCFDWLPGVSARLDGLAGHEGLLRPGARIAPLPPLGREVGGAGDPGEALVARLKAAAPGTYLVVGHPGYDEADMRQFRHAGLGAGEVARERDRERRQFTSPAVLEYARAGGVEFVRYTDVLR